MAAAPEEDWDGGDPGSADWWGDQRLYVVVTGIGGMGRAGEDE